MYRSVIFKEWLKTRWAFLTVGVINLAVLINIFLKLSSSFRFIPANKIFDSVIFKQYIYYSDLQYIPLFSALIIALAQYIPEIVQNRLKLSFHLPVKENKILLQMVSFGLISLLLTYALESALLCIISAVYFPAEIIISALSTIAPWLMSGITAYFIVAAVSVEPAWKRRAAIAVMGMGVIYFFFFGDGYGAYSKVLVHFTVLSLLTMFIVFVSGYRFKRGYR